MRNHRTTSELHDIVGPRRSQYSQKAVASAERELELRAEGEEALFQRKLTRSGLICAGIGAFCVVWPALLLLAFTHLAIGTGTASPNEPFVFRHFNSIFVAVACIQIFCGAMLLSGGLAVRSRKSVGPHLVAIPIVVCMLYLFAFPVSIAFTDLMFEAPWPIRLIPLAFASLQSCVFLFLLWLPLRFFLSPRVTASCNSPSA